MNARLSLKRVPVKLTYNGACWRPIKNGES